MTLKTNPSDIQKAETDKRVFRLVTLSNKLQALLVSDPETDKAAAAMDVHVGHLSDPSEAPGLAHFCEHLLFMGNEKYPLENDYSQFLSTHGGSSNAFTSADHTNYYFDVKADFLEGALDRFTQFFVSPLFDASCTEREMKAVDSEHSKNIQQDSWRIYQLQKDLTSKEHPYSKFGTGNLKTLKDYPESLGIDVRRLLLDFHNRLYSANIMKLVVIGKESLDQLQQWVVEKASAIKNKDIDPPSWPGHPMTKDDLLKQIFVKPVKDLRSLKLTFPLPDLTEFYLCKPASYASHLIGHESEGSILALLKQKGWANDLSAGASSGAINFEFFTISIGLTEEGSKHWEEIVVVVFQYIAMLREAGVKDWIYEECQTLSEVQFRFQEKRSPASFASRVAGDIHYYSPEHVLSGPSVMFKMNKKEIQSVLDALNVENFRITLLSPDFKSSEWQKANHYQTEFQYEAISQSLKRELHAIRPNTALHLPLKNEFIPGNLTVKRTHLSAQRRPDLVFDSNIVRLWHKKDDTFWVPKAKVMFILKSPLAYATPSTCVITRLFTDCLDDVLNQFSYYASVAGLDYHLTNSTEGIELTLSGYNDKLQHLLQRILTTAKHLKIDRKRFVAVKEALGRSYKNWAQEQPYQHAAFFASYVTQEKLWTSEEKLEVLDDISAEDVEAFYPQLLARLNVEGFVFGNVEASEAVALAKALQEELRCKSLPAALHNQVVRTHIFPNGKHLIHQRQVANVNQLNSALEHLIQIGDVSNADLRTKTLLFAQIAKEPCFDVLRTKEQLGYIVASGIRKQTGMISFRILIQSEKGPAFLESRAEQFLLSLRDTVADMSDKDFQKNIDTVAFNLTEKDKNMSQEAHRIWNHISNRYYDFEEEENDAKKVITISRGQLLHFYDEYISPNSRTRRVLSIHLASAKATSEGTSGQNVSDVAHISDSLDELIPRVLVDSTGVAELKASMQLSRSPVPVVPLSAFRTGVSKI
ncbi:Metalloenzyme, LuxS/M16 peptidase-like protein [Chytriomyces sp. MP71]|nr:Metalloenzyme, LuxS/M16 peptidase-like protein [Chytriomyces sp. MP71]